MISLNVKMWLTAAAVSLAAASCAHDLDSVAPPCATSADCEQGKTCGPNHRCVSDRDGAADDLNADAPRDDMARADLDAGADAPIADAPGDQAAADALAEAGKDLVASEGQVPDQSQPDWGTTTGGVMYLTGSSSNKLSAAQVRLDGTGTKAVPGLPASFELLAVTLAGRQEIGAISRHVPNAVGHISALHRPVSLPGSLGQLFLYETTAGRGIFVVRPDGTAKVLDFFTIFNLGDTGYHTTMGINAAGTVIAAVLNDQSITSSSIRLFRTDNQTFGSTGKYVCFATSNSVGPVVATSLTFTNKYLYFLVKSSASTSKTHLERAPLDCSTTSLPVTLPKVGSWATPDTMHPHLGLSADRKKVVVVAGSPTYKDVIVVDAATGQGTNVSGSEGQYGSPGAHHMVNTPATSSMVDISPSGKNIAWVKTVSGKHTLRVRPVDKSAPTIQVNGPANFKPSHDTVVALRWSDDDNLFFWTGPGAAGMDMFRYTVTTAALSQITTTGGTVKPYGGSPTLWPDGGWTSKSGLHFYFLQHDDAASVPKRSIRRIDLKASAVTSVATQGKYIVPGSNLVAAQKSGEVFYRASLTKVSQDENLWVFDPDTPSSAPQQVTTFTGNNFIFKFAPSADGTRVAFGASNKSNKDQSLYVVTAPTQPKKLSTPPTTFISEVMWFIPGGNAVAYGVGSSVSATDVRIQPTTGSADKVLYSGKGYSTVIMVW